MIDWNELAIDSTVIATTAATTTALPAVAMRAADVAPVPRARNALTAGRSVAASTPERMTGRVTIGTWRIPRMTTDSVAMTTSARQLHWPSRSSQTGTRLGGRSGGASPSSMSIATGARVMTAATTGT